MRLFFVLKRCPHCLQFDHVLSWQSRFYRRPQRILPTSVLCTLCVLRGFLLRPVLNPSETPVVSCLCLCSEEVPAATSHCVRANSFVVVSEWWNVVFPALILCCVVSHVGLYEVSSMHALVLLIQFSEFFVVKLKMFYSDFGDSQEFSGLIETLCERWTQRCCVRTGDENVLRAPVANHASRFWLDNVDGAEH